MTLRVSRPLVVCSCVLLLTACAQEELPWAPSIGGGGATAATVRRGNALWGSSVISLGDGKAAVALTEADEVRVVGLATGSSRRVDFPPGSRPSRMATTGPGAFVVVLRGTGDVAKVVNGVVREQQPACDEPRGVAWDDARQATLVACADGQLVTLTGGTRRAVQVGEELRDVFRVKDTTWVTTFRTAELLELNAEGQVVTRLAPPRFSVTRPDAQGVLQPLTFTPRLAWRTVAEGTRVAMVHQVHLDDEVTTLTVTPGTPPSAAPPYYGSGATCGTSVVMSALTTFDLDRRAVASSTPVLGSLPVDVAANAGFIALVTLGDGAVATVPWSLTTATPCLGGTPAGTPAPVGVGLFDDGVVVVGHDGAVVRPQTSMTFAQPTEVVSQPTAAPLDEARAFFHRQSPSGVACASCHAEGHEDGHTWNFQGQHVRTQDLSGGLSDTAPFHWQGELRNLEAVLHSTFETRMGGTLDPAFSTLSLGRWLDSLPARPGVSAPAQPGEAVFQAAGCAGCHAGPRFTNNQTVDVGTGGAFQVPSLKGLRWRGPWMHDGCAKTLADRFTPACGGERHGAVAPSDVPDLVKYLESL